MSYYSDVKCVMYKDAWKKFQNRIILPTEDDDWNIDRQILLNRAIEVNIPKANGKDIVVVTFETINYWGRNNYATKEFMKYLDELEEKKEPFKFIRLGEGANDIEDIEVRSYIPEDLDIASDIDIIEVKRSISIASKFGKRIEVE